MDIYSGFSMARIGPVHWEIYDHTLDVTKVFTIGEGFYQHTQPGGSLSTEIPYDTRFFQIDPSNYFTNFTAYTSFSDLVLQMVRDAFDDETWNISFTYISKAGSPSSDGVYFYYDFVGPNQFDLNIDIGTAAGQNALKIFGFSASPGDSGLGAEVASDVTPYYVNRAGTAQVLPLEVANSTDEYEPDTIAFDGEADDGSSYGIAWTRAPLYWDFEVPFETKPATFNYVADALIPYTWERMFQSVRNIDPLMIMPDNAVGSPYPFDDPTATIVKLRADGARFKPMRMVSDFDGFWNIPFRTRILDRQVPTEGGGG